MRRFLLPALLLAAAPLAQAQTTFGITAGLNVANVSVSGNNDLDTSSRLGFVGGAFADVALTPMLTFHPELLYSQKGYKLDGDDAGSITAQVDYLEVPLLAAYHIPVGQNGLMVGIEAGPTLAYKLRTGISCSGDIAAFCDDVDDSDLDDAIRDFDLGIAGGASIGAGPFGVALRYTQGITSIADNGDNNNDDTTVRNGVFSVSARYSFGRR